MKEWVNFKDCMPDTELECVVARKTHNLIYTHKVYAQWDGTRWVDANGDELNDVIAWMKAPEYPKVIIRLIEKLERCLEKDTCENQDCLYFANQDSIRDLLEYIKQ